MIPSMKSFTLIQLASIATIVSTQSNHPTYTPSTLPHTWQPGQTGYNDCGTTDSQTSNCQTAYVNSLTDFCLWAPPTPGQDIGSTERVEVAWCTSTGHGARLIPQGTITAAHYLETPHYIQITGQGVLTNINIQAGDAGGELDPHGADGNGNPIGGLVFANGVQIHEWTSFISDTQFCFRICKDAPDAESWCQHVYDLQGCMWNEPGNYELGFDSCQGDSTVSPPGVYVNNGVTSIYSQGDGSNPPAHTAGKSSNCQTLNAFTGAIIASTTSSTSNVSTVSTATSTSSISTITSSSSTNSTGIVTITSSTTAVASTDSTLITLTLTPSRPSGSVISPSGSGTTSISGSASTSSTATFLSSSPFSSSTTTASSNGNTLRAGGLLFGLMIVGLVL